MVKLPIYMDNHATTPLDPRVLDAMMPFFTDKFGNAASRNHKFGWEAKEGFRVTFLPVDNKGFVDLDDLRKAITDKTILISIMTANNEVGVIQDIKEIGAIARQRGVLFHTDAVQAAGKVPFNVNEMNV